MRYCQEKGVVCQYAGDNLRCRITACVMDGSFRIRITNADRIRAMSDEELAEFLAEEQLRIANVVFQTVGYRLEKQAIYARRLDWLQQLYEGE